MLVYYVYCFTRLKLLGEVAHHGILDEDIFTDVFQKLIMKNYWKLCMSIAYK